jgi:hypothetical protein
MPSSRKRTKKGQKKEVKKKLEKSKLSEPN